MAVDMSEDDLLLLEYERQGEMSPREWAAMRRSLIWGAILLGWMVTIAVAAHTLPRPLIYGAGLLSLIGVWLCVTCIPSKPNQ